MERAVVFLLAVLLLFGAGCNSETTPVPSAEPPAHGLLPKPGQLPRSASLSGELSQNGADYLDSLPHRRVERAGSTASYTPLGAGWDELAFAIHHFDLTGLGSEQNILFEWQEPWPLSSEPSNFWLGLSDWQSGHWRWQPVTSLDEFSIEDIAPFIRAEDGAFYCVLLFTGGGNPQLARIEFARAPEIESVSPLTVEQGLAVQMQAAVNGSGPLSYSWNFGEGAVPATSSEASPLITPGTPGSYECSLFVTNSVGADLLEFTLNVTEAPGPGWVHSISPSSFALDCMPDGEGLVLLTSSVNLLRIDSDGSLDWGYTYYFAGPDKLLQAESLARDAQGSYYIGGNYNNDVISNAEGLFLLKTDSTGTLLWAREWPAESFRESGSVAVDSAGNAYVTGSTRDSGQGLDDAVLLKFDGAGNLLAQRTWGTAEFETGEDLICDSADNLYMSGYRHLLLSGNSFETFLLKFEADGDLVRQQGFTCSNDTRLALRPNGNIVMAQGDGSPTVLCELDGSGSVLWARSYLHTASTFISDLEIAADGSIWTSGAWKFDNLFDKLDCELMHCDSTGNLISARWWNSGDVHESFECMCLGPEDSLYLSGYSDTWQGGWQTVTGDVAVSQATLNPSNPGGVLASSPVAAAELSLTRFEPEWSIDDPEAGSGKSLIMRYTPPQS